MKKERRNENGHAEFKADPPAGEYRRFSFFLFCFSCRPQDGYAALAMTILVVSVSLTIIGGLSFFSLQEAAANRAYTKSVVSRYIAEGGTEDALYRLITSRQISSGQTLGAGDGTATVRLTVNPDGTRLIRSDAQAGVITQSIETLLGPATASSTGYDVLYWKDAK